MKKVFGLLCSVFIVTSLFAQQMQVKVPVFSGVMTDKKAVPKELDKVATIAAKTHPDYGYLPYNAPCSTCAELPDKRTMFSRTFIDSTNAKHFYSQQSYFPLHYRLGENEPWRLIDTRLMPDSEHQGVYMAKKQPVPTKCDLNRKSTSILYQDFEFESNRNLTMYFFDADNAVSKPATADYSNYSIGAEGLLVKNIWPGIDMQQLFYSGEIETNYIINAPLQLPISKGWMVIEDHFNLPEGYGIEEHAGSHYQNGYYSGDYVITNERGDNVILYSKPVYVDAKAWGMHGMYKLIKEGNNYTVQTLVPVNWLSSTDNVYPLLIDPTVSGIVDTGTFSTTTPQHYIGMGFTTRALGSCNYQLTDTVPGGNMLTNAYVDLEYHLTYSDSCGHPAEAAPYCTFTQVVQEVINDWCNTTSGGLGCNPALPPFTGTCTTDPLLVPGASAIEITSFNPTYLACIAPQCPDYHIKFTLKNTDSICGDVCGYLCATGHMWRMTIEACGLDGFITQNKTRVCAGQSAIFTAHPSCGVPPYHYLWSPDGGNTFDTIYGNPDYVVTTSSSLSHPDSVYVTCYVMDTCGDLASTNSLQLNIIPSPRADAGPDISLCRGGAALIGGSPTTNNAANPVWKGSNPTVQSWLSSTLTSNPTVTVPPGTVDTFFYSLMATNTLCFNTDTVYVFSSNGEHVSIDSGGTTKICTGASVKLIVQGGPFLSYAWNNGNAGSSIYATQAGQYFVIVKDSLGCIDTSNVINVTTTGPPSVQAFPDTTIQVGDSVTLYSDLVLGSPGIDSFFWSPNISISCLNCANPRVAPAGSQTYGLTVYSGGCQVSASVLIQVILPDNFFIPNVFTPNGDGNNDEFYIEYQSGVTVLQFQIFDRWGEKVHDGQYPWDGNYKGKPAPQAVYVYVFKLQLYGRDLALTRKGSVTLLR